MVVLMMREGCWGGRRGATTLTITMTDTALAGWLDWGRRKWWRELVGGVSNVPGLCATPPGQLGSPAQQRVLWLLLLLPREMQSI